MDLIRNGAVLDGVFVRARRGCAGNLLAPIYVAAFVGVALAFVPFLAIAADVVPPSAAEKPPLAPIKSVRVWAHQGYGRIVFDWNSAVSYRVRSGQDTAVIVFDAPLGALTLPDIAGHLKDYATAAHIGQDGRSIVLALRPGVHTRTFTTPSSLVLDLAAHTPSAAAADADTTASPVPVRFGEHPTFSRLVFGWNGDVDYKVVSRRGEAIVRFSRDARFALGPVRQDLPKFVKGVTAKSAGKGSAVTVLTSPGARVRHFRSGGDVVVDILEPDGKNQPVGAAPGGDAADNSAGPKRPTEPAALRMRAPVATKSEGAPAPRKLPGGAASAATRRSVGVPVSLLGDKHSAVSPLTPVPVILSLENDAATIKFHWPKAVGSAVFERAGYLWSVFGGEARLDFQGWTKVLAKRSPNSKRRKNGNAAAALVASPEFMSQPGATIFRMRLPSGVSPRVGRDGPAWIVTLERNYLKPASGVPVESYLSPASGARLLIATSDAGDPLTIQDPEVGDQLTVVPMAAPGAGIGLSRRYAEFELFATSQGIAGRTLGEGISFRKLASGIEIASKEGLSLSGTNPAERRAAGPDRAKAPPGQTRPGWLFDFESWRRQATGTFTKNKHEIQQAAAAAPPTTRNAIRLQLAQLYFSYDFLTDTLGLLKVIEQDEPELAHEPVFRALRGAAYYGLGDYDRAGRDLNDASLNSFKEVALWRAGLAAAKGDWTTAARFFTRGEGIFKVYPKRLRIHFGILAAEAALHIGDVGLAKFHLDTLERLSPEPRDMASIRYLRGRLLAKVMEPDGAVDSWTRAISGPNRRIRVLAMIARTDLLLTNQKISKKAAAAELEKLRFEWRGDALEFQVLNRLGKAYIDAGNYRDGLLTLREAATHFPKNPATEAVIDTMRAAFIKLFVDGESEKLAPLTALALYDQFRELTPEGELGDRLIARLAERLVAVDLLDRAATLLHHLVDKRLTGTDRFETANRLALVLLFDRKPEDAIKALAGQVPNNVIPETARARRHLKARGLAELARYNEALALLAGDESFNADLLRAEIHWRTRSWARAAVAYERIIKVQDRPGAAPNGGAGIDLAPQLQRNILNLAIAYALGHDGKGLARLRTRFADRMSRTELKESFDVVTDQSGAVRSDYGVISKKIAEVDQFREFMKSYRQKLISRGTGVSDVSSAAPAKRGAKS